LIYSSFNFKGNRWNFKGSNDSSDSILDERGTLEADMYKGMENNRLLREITSLSPKPSCPMWVVGPKAKTS
jgi:hypothetical protein